MRDADADFLIGRIDHALKVNRRIEPEHPGIVGGGVGAAVDILADLKRGVSGSKRARARARAVGVGMGNRPSIDDPLRLLLRGNRQRTVDRVAGQTMLRAQVVNPREQIAAILRLRREHHDPIRQHNEQKQLPSHRRVF